MTLRSTPRALPHRALACLAGARDQAVALAAACAVIGGVAASPSAIAAVTAGASAAASAPLSASGAASASGAQVASAATHYTVKPGQTLSDIAIAVTQSHDRAVFGRASKAIFDANPWAFMRGDPSLMKGGAVLNVPALDASGAPVQAAAAAAAAASAPAAASGPAAGASAAIASSASMPTAAGSAPVGSASSAAASAGASGVAGLTAPHQQAGAAPTGGAQAPAGASSGHAWTGSIQLAQSVSVDAAASATGAASAPAAASMASGVAAAVAPAASAASAASSPRAASPSSASAAASAPAAVAHASGPRATVSSLQQLLALKNRVLMELQRHGFGAPSPREQATRASVAAVAPAPAPAFQTASSAPGARAPVTPARMPAANERFIGIGGYGFALSRPPIPVVAAIVAAVVAALLVLLVVRSAGRRKRRAGQTEAVPASLSAHGDAPSAPVGEQPEEAKAAWVPQDPQDPVEAEFLAILARTPTSKRALMGLVGHFAERGNVRGFDEIAQRIWHLSEGRGPNWQHVASFGRQLDPQNPLYALGSASEEETAAQPEAQDGAQAHEEAASSAEPGVAEADAETQAAQNMHPVPPTEPAAEEAPAEAPGEPAAVPHAAVSEVSPAEEAPLVHIEPSWPESASVAAHAGTEEGPRLAEPPSAEAAPAEQAESALSAAAEEPAAPNPPNELDAQFPADAISALDDLDMALPPRIESSPQAPEMADAQAAAAAPSPVSLTTQPVMAPSVTEQQAVPAESEAPHAGSAIEAGIAGAAAVAGLGAARFGALDLSFDLDLPGASAQAHTSAPPLPTFTPEQLAKIARNKLELAAEYIALGDLGGARTLIHEVIESNDAGTRDEAHALLATLAPLS